MTSDEVEQVALCDIDPALWMRKQLDEEKLAGLMQSIQEVDLIYPVRLTWEGDKLVPYDGCHRIAAFARLGRKTIPAFIDATPLTEAEKLHRGLIANGQRIENTPIEKAEAISRLMQLNSWTAATAATKLGVSSAMVTKLLALLGLDPDVKELVHAGKLPASTGYQISRIEDAGEQRRLAAMAASGNLSRDGVSGARKCQEPRSQGAEYVSASRVVAALRGGRSVTVQGQCKSLDAVIEILESTLHSARKARAKGLAVATWTRLLRDESKS
jgi:ParB/RepB/Spo0J family partition protein